MSKNVRTLPVFPKRDMRFDPAVDLQDVDQFGFINLAESFEKGIIPGGVELSDESFNNVVNPGTLIGRSMDVFDGLRKSQYVKSQLDKMTADEREKAEKALQQNAQKVTMEVSSEG